MTRLLVALALLAFAPACGSQRPEADVERGRRAVAALDAWKANEPPTKLKSLPDPVEFTEEMRATHTLTEYTLGKVDASESEVIRYAVTLKLKDKKGKPSDREAVYAVALKSPVVVARPVLLTHAPGENARSRGTGPQTGAATEQSDSTDRSAEPVGRG